MNKNNSYLIDVLDFREIDKEMLRITPNYKGHKWAEPSEIHLRPLMREVYENYSDAIAKGKIARKEMVDNFSWKPVAEKLKQAINSLS